MLVPTFNCPQLDSYYMNLNAEGSVMDSGSTAVSDLEHLGHDVKRSVILFIMRPPETKQSV
jgi:hypothetical protein